jgi:hypothetical protein
MTSASPARMRSAAMATASSPDAQKRFTVAPGVLWGSPARRAATRATFMPDSPSGVAQPKMTSSISLGLYGGASGEDGLDRHRGEVVRSGMAQAAARGFADGRARRCHNHGFVAHACLHKAKGYLMGFGRSYSASAYSSVATRT